MAEQKTGFEKLIGSVKALTNNKTLYGAYKDIKDINSSPIQPVQKNSGIGDLTNGASGTGGTTDRTSTTGTTNIDNNSNITQSRTSLEALNKIHNDLSRMNITVEKISAFTSLLARNSVLSLAQGTLTNANSTARINENEINSQPAAKGHKAKQEEKSEGSLVGSVAKGMALRAAAPALVPLAVTAAVAAGSIITARAVKSGANWMLDFPDGPAKDLVIKLIARKKISWGWTDLYPKILDTSYLRSLPKDQIALLIDSGKFSGQDLGALKVILQEPQSKTKTPTTQPQAKTKVVPVKEIKPDVSAQKDISNTEDPLEKKAKQLDVVGKTEKTFVGDQLIDSNKTSTKEQVALSNTNTSIRKELSPDVQSAYDLTKTSGIGNIAPDLQTHIEEPAANDINVDEINVPTKEKSLNFGVVAIKTLNIQELILPDGTGLFSDKEDKKSFLDDLEEGLSKGWSKVKDTFSSIGDSIGNAFSPHDQGDLRRQKAKSEETAYDKASGKYGSDADAKTATKMLMDKGWTKEQASGIAANLNAESRFNTKASGDKSKISGVDQAKGIAQWHPDRQKKFEELSGKKIEDASFEEQINFVDWELKNTNKAAGEKIRATKTASAAAAATEQHYERSAVGLKGGVQQERVENAERYAKMDIGTPENQQVASTEVPKKNDTGTAYFPYVEPQKTATLEKQQTQSSGNIITDAQSAQSQVTKAPDLSEDNLKRIADQASKPQAPIVVQAPAAPAQQQKATTAPIMAVRDDSPMILNMQYGNLRV